MTHKRIDVHTHILPREMPKFKDKFGYGGFIGLDHSCGCNRARIVRDDGRFFREIESNCWDPIQRLQECDVNGVSVQVLSTVPVCFSYWAKARDGLEVARFLNDGIAEIVVKDRDRFIGLGTLPMQDPGLACEELERCVKTLGFAGIQIGTHINQWNLNAPEVCEVFACAEKIDAAIFVHPWDMMGEERMQKYWLPWLVGMPAETSLAICSMIFGGVFEKFPRLRVMFAHGGGAFPGTLGRIQHGFEVRPDLCAVDNAVSPLDSLNKFYVDSLVHDRRALESVLEIFSASRVALGSDYPFPLGEDKPGQLIESMGFTPITRDRLLWGTALEWLGKARIRSEILKQFL